jgi:hypothetical protein
MLERPLAEKKLSLESPALISYQQSLDKFAYLSPFSSYSPQIDLITTETPPSGENIFI